MPRNPDRMTVELATFRRLLKKRGLTDREIAATIAAKEDIDAQRRMLNKLANNFDALQAPLRAHIATMYARISTERKRAPHRAETMRQYIEVLRKTRDHIEECRARCPVGTPLREVLRTCHPNPETWPAPHHGAIWMDWVSPRAKAYILARVDADNTLDPPQRQGFRPFRPGNVNAKIERRWAVLLAKVTHLKREHTLSLIANQVPEALDVQNYAVQTTTGRRNEYERIVSEALARYANGTGLRLSSYDARVFAVLNDATRMIHTRGERIQAPLMWTQLLSIPDAEFARGWETDRLAHGPAGVIPGTSTQEIPS